MSKITYDKDNKVISRVGEHFKDVDSCYTTPRSLHESDLYNDPLFAALEGDVDELTNKPRRFFDHLLSIMEYKRDNAPDIDKAAYDDLILGCELWLSAVNNGLFGEVLRLGKEAGAVSNDAKELLKDYAA